MQTNEIQVNQSQPNLTASDKEKIVADTVQQLSTWDKDMIVYFMKLMTTFLHEDEKMEIRQSLKRTRESDQESILSEKSDLQMEEEGEIIDSQSTHSTNAVTIDKNNEYHYDFPDLPPNKKIRQNKLAKPNTKQNPKKGKQPIDNHPTNSGKATMQTKNQTTKSEETKTNQNERPRNDKVPPIIILNKNHYNDIIEITKKHNIKLKHIKNTNKGLETHVNDIEDYRKLSSVLTFNKQGYFTFLLPEEKTLKVVLRGIPEEIEVAQIEQNLIDSGFQPLKINRMFKTIIDPETNAKTKVPMPLILVQLEKNDLNKKIYNIDKLGFLAIKVEPLNIKKTIRQCHKCQDFGHTEARCFCPPKCHKCAGHHYWKDCSKPKTEAPCCANCNGPHPANYKGCPLFPKPKSAPQKQPNLILKPSYT